LTGVDSTSALQAEATHLAARVLTMATNDVSPESMLEGAFDGNTLSLNTFKGLYTPYLGKQMVTTFFCSNSSPRVTCYTFIRAV
jgi:hypothetical protein